MADDTNEDSWLYGTSNPDSTTNEEYRSVADLEQTGATKDVNVPGDITLGNVKTFENEATPVVVNENLEVKELDKKEEEEDLPVEDASEDELRKLDEHMDHVARLAGTGGVDVEDYDMTAFEDPAQEMEEDEDAAVDATEKSLDSAGLSNDKPEEAFEKTAVGSDDDVDDDDDDSDDDINVVIDIKNPPTTYNIKQRSTLITGSVGQEKTKSLTHQGGKFSIEEFESAGQINGIPINEFSIDSLDEKPWRKPGADITDYFNYGFNEETWRAYCERQKRFRVVESGVGLSGLTQNSNPPAVDRSASTPEVTRPPSNNGPSAPLIAQLPIPTPSSNEHNISMPPPGLIPIPNSMTSHQMPPRFNMPRPPRPLLTPSKENLIQVMTAACREYPRQPQMPPNFNGPMQGPNQVGGEQFFHEPESFGYGYEPTQESHWNNDNTNNWMPSGIKELTPGPNMGPPPTQMNVPPMMSGGPMPMGGPPQMSGPPPQMRPPHPQGPLMGGLMPPPNMGMGPPPNMSLLMNPNNGPPMRMPNMGNQCLIMPNGPPERQNEDDRDRRRREKDWDRERDRDREKSRRERSRSREKSRRRSKSRDKEREKDRDKERDKDRDKDRSERIERDRERDRDRDKERDRERDKERNEKEDNDRPEEDRDRRRRDRDRDKDRERSRRDRSRSRDKNRRRSKSREKDRDRSNKSNSSSSAPSGTSNRSDKKKSHRKDEDE